MDSRVRRQQSGSILHELDLFFRHPISTLRYWFELDSAFARQQSYRWFRRVGMLLNLLSALAAGILLRNFPIGVLSLLSLLAFYLCIRMVRVAWAGTMGMLLALYWGAIGWIVTKSLLLLPQIPALPVLAVDQVRLLPLIIAGGAFLISAFLHINYIKHRLD